jgi:hypothetical protein
MRTLTMESVEALGLEVPTRFVIDGDARCGCCAAPMVTGDFWSPVFDERGTSVAVCLQCSHADALWVRARVRVRRGW